MAGEREELLRWLTGMLQQFAAQLGDPGEVVTAKVDGAGESAAAEVDDDRRWVAVWLQSVVDGRRRFLGRLLSPGGLLWWLPEQGEIGAMLRSGNLTGALTTYFLGGHGGAANRVPSWLSSERWGIFARAGKKLRVESADQDLELRAPSGVVDVNGTDHPLPRFDTFEGDLSDLLNDIVTALAQGTAGSPVKQQLTGLAALQASVAAFRVKLADGTYESTKGKNG